MADIKKIPQNFGINLEKALGRDGALYFKDVVDSVNTKIDELITATEGNVAVFDASGRLSDYGNAPLSISLDGLRIAASDTDGELVSIEDLTQWIGGVSGRIAVSDDGDGTLTLTVPLKSGFGITSDANGLSLNQQANVVDASAVSAVTLTAGGDTVSISSCNSTLATLVTEINAIKDKVNAILDILLDSEVMAAP